MQIVKHRRIRLGWIFITILACAYFYSLFHGFFGWSVVMEYPLMGLLISGALIAAVLWRGLAYKTKFTLTGLEIPALLCIAAGGLSLYFSPDRRMSLEPGLWAVLCLALFFVFSDLLSNGAYRKGVLAVLMGATGTAAVFACMEVYYWYSRWWQASGSLLNLPPYPYRFTSIMGHANIYMAFANLLAPVALVLFFKTRTMVYRLLAALWLVFYLISVPFSSSRGGWLGLLVWAAVLSVLWLPGSPAWKTGRAFYTRHRLSVLLSGLIVLTGFLVAGYRFWIVFAASPSHGGDPFGGREELWSQALQVWRLSPWVGAGVGRYPYAYLQIAPVFPPGFWSVHAHDWFLTVLGEQGIVGLGAFLLLVTTSMISLYRWRRGSPASFSLYAAAIFAGMAGFLVHSIFDDFSADLAMMTTLALLAAMVWGGVPKQTSRSRKVSSAALALPLLPLALTFGWLLWAGHPLELGLQTAKQGNHRQVAELASQTVRRDPQYVFAQAEAGLAWARVWGESKDTADLQRARVYLDTARRMEPSYSLSWANSAMLDWAAGEQITAIEEMQQAILHAPQEPSYPLNLGWFYEQQGNLGEARVSYQKSLDLSPAWAGNPFWQENAFRAAIATGVNQRNEADLAADPPSWKQALDAISVGQLDAADYFIRMGEASGEDTAALWVAEARLAKAHGDAEIEEGFVEQLRSLQNPYTLYGGPYVAGKYGILHRRNAFDLELVPGYLNLAPNYGQFQLIDEQ